MEKKQIIFIRGGEAFDTEEQFWNYIENRKYNPFETNKSWRDWIGWALSEEFEVMEPNMPNKQKAQYSAWKIWFEKLFPFLNSQELIIIGHSLGSIFLAKYLSENKFPKQISQLHLVSPIFDSEGLVGETAGDFVFDSRNLKNLEEQADEIYLYHSEDDPLVPIEHTKKYVDELPSASVQIFKDRGHFAQPSFPELLENINRNENS